MVPRSQGLRRRVEAAESETLALFLDRFVDVLAAELRSRPSDLTRAVLARLADLQRSPARGDLIEQMIAAVASVDREFGTVIQKQLGRSD